MPHENSQQLNPVCKYCDRETVLQNSQLGIALYARAYLDTAYCRDMLMPWAPPPPTNGLALI
jgi:hypothetical protein